MLEIELTGGAGLAPLLKGATEEDRLFDEFRQRFFCASAVVFPPPVYAKNEFNIGAKKCIYRKNRTKFLYYFYN